MIELLRQTAKDESLVNKSLTGGSGQDQKTYQVKSMDDFSYTDPIDGIVTEKQVNWMLDLIVNSPLKLLHISLYISHENLVLDQDSSFYLISLNILITCLLNNVWIL